MNTCLPIASYEEQIVEAVRENQVTILVGETGSGKTTQVPIFLLNAGFGLRGRIGVTEPRRLAATSVASYVSEQIGCVLGKEVGYQIRFDLTSGSGTRIKFMTDGILLQEAVHDPLFQNYEVLIIDEVHERNLNTDFILGLVKRALSHRSDLKVVIMSATIDSGRFAEFFGAPILKVEGKTYPVEVNYLTQEEIELYQYDKDPIERLAAYQVDQILRSGEPGDILVFMPGKGEIDKTIRFVNELGYQDLSILPVYGEMSPEDQSRIFQPDTKRRVIVATNIAETSITIDGVVHVVDSGLIRETDFDPLTGITGLKVVEHSQAGLVQRAGRAGRTQPGFCWRLFTEEEYTTGRFPFKKKWEEEDRAKFTKPEIQRSDLVGVILRMIGIGIADVHNFEFLDQPDTDTINHAFDTLQEIEALDDEDKITETGWKLLKLPVEPRIGKMILKAIDYGCVAEICTIAASLSARNIFFRPMGDEEEQFKAEKAKRKFSDSRSDFLTLIHVVNEYENHSRDRNWAKENYLNSRSLEEILKVRRQLIQLLEKSGIPISSIGYEKPANIWNATDSQKAQAEAIGKSILAAFLKNLLIHDYRYAYKSLFQSHPVFIHPSSGLFGEQPELITCLKVVSGKDHRGGKKYSAQSCMRVEIRWIEETAPHLIRREEKTYKSPYLWGGEKRRTLTTYINEVEVHSQDLPPEETDREEPTEERPPSKLGEVISRIMAATQAKVEPEERPKEERVANPEFPGPKADETLPKVEEKPSLQKEEDIQALQAWIKEHESWPGFGHYSFKVDEGGNPLDYTIGGDTYEFDWESSEELPEEGKTYYGFITQEIQKGIRCIRKVALLRQIPEKELCRA